MIDKHNFKIKESELIVPQESCMPSGFHDWKIAGNINFAESKGVFGRKTYFFTRCCSYQMLRVVEFWRYACSKCGSSRDKIVGIKWAVCPHCGKRITKK